MLNDYLSDLHFWETLGLIMFGSILLWSIFSGISSLIQHWRRPERPDAPAPLPADDREDFIRDRKREEPNKREMPLPAPFRPLRSDDDIVTGDFDRMFLQPRSIRARSALYVSSETKRKVLEVVRKVGDEHTTATEHQNRIVRSRRKPPIPTVAFSKMPEMEIRKARPLGDSHGLAYFHLRRLIPCRRENLHRKLPCHRRSKIGNRISCKIVGHYCATLKTLLSFSLNAAISCPILSLVILA